MRGVAVVEPGPLREANRAPDVTLSFGEKMMVRLVRLRLSLLIVALILLRNYNSGNTNLGRAAQGLAAELAGIER